MKLLIKKCGNYWLDENESSQTKHKQKECKRCSLLVFANSWSSHQSKCSETKLKCKLCYFETSQKSNLQAHIKSIHEAVDKERVKKDHKCMQCKKTFNMKKGFDRHVKIHSSVKEMPCILCDKKFANHEYHSPGKMPYINLQF